MANTAVFKGFSGLFQAAALVQNEALLKGFAGHYGSAHLQYNGVTFAGFSGHFGSSQLVQNDAILKGFSGFFRGSDPTIEESQAPATPILAQIDGEQDLTPSEGRSKVTVRWVVPTVTQLTSGEYLGLASGAEETFDLVSGDVATGSGQVYEITGYSAGGVDTTLSAGVNKQQNKIILIAGSLVADDWVELVEGSVKEFAQVRSFSSSTAVLYHPLQHTFTVACTVKEVDASGKTETTDYTLDRTGGIITLLSGKFTAGKAVLIRYATNLNDLDHFESHRLDGDHPVADQYPLEDIIGHASHVAVDTNIDPGDTSFVDTLAVGDNAETVTYYLSAVDTKGNASPGQGTMVETLPPVVQNLQKSVTTEDVTLTWDAPSGANVNGVNIYRSENSWNPSTALRVNSVVLTGTSFVDGPDNVTTRRPPGEVPYPTDLPTYFYAAEVVDSLTEWDTGTENEASNPPQSQVNIATKVDD